jgi:hypothetical protein
MPLLGPLLARVLTLENACWLARVSVDGVVDHMARAERGARRAAGSGGLS